jgi:hypothetical protein
VLWVLRDTLSGEVLLARSLDSARQDDLAELLREVKDALPAPIHGVISDAQRPIRLAVQTELKKHVKGVREIERSVVKREDEEAETIRGYCLAVRSALDDEGKPPLQLPGLLMHERLTAIAASLERVQQRGATR